MQIETELVLKVGRKELRLSPDEARELRDALVELVGPSYAYPYYVQPYQPIWVTPTTADPLYIPSVTTSGYAEVSGPVATDTVTTYIQAH